MTKGPVMNLVECWNAIIKLAKQNNCRVEALKLVYEPVAGKGRLEMERKPKRRRKGETDPGAEEVGA